MALFKFYSNCIPVKGATRSAICDLQKNKYYLVPHDLICLIKNDTIDVEKITSSLNERDLTVFYEYLEYLLEHEVIFECSEVLLDNFPPLSLRWDYPAKISNAIFDTYTQMAWFDESTLKQLEFLCCNYLELRYFGIAEDRDLERVCELINSSQIKCIDLILKNSPESGFLDWLYALVVKNKKIRCVTIHSSDTDEVIEHDGKGYGIILSVKEIVNDESHCGNISHLSFCTNVQLFTEALEHNSCLNRKIAVDKYGNIKNCPSMRESYGNIADTPLSIAVEKQGFSKLWNISKDEIDVCKDCEFRYICTDCRAYVENPEDIYSKPLKCGYDPYTCKWEEWSLNPLKEASINYYGYLTR